MVWATITTKMPLNIHENEAGHAASNPSLLPHLWVKAAVEARKWLPPHICLLNLLAYVCDSLLPGWPPMTPASWGWPPGGVHRPLYQGWSVWLIEPRRSDGGSLPRLGCRWCCDFNHMTSIPCSLHLSDPLLWEKPLALSWGHSFSLVAKPTGWETEPSYQ